MYTAKIHHNNNSYEYNFEKPVLITDAFLASGVEHPHPCAGKHTCGKCKVKVTGDVTKPSTDELAFLSNSEVAGDIRLSCFAYMNGDCEITVSNNNAKILSGADTDFSSVNNGSQTGIGIAFDIGTTTVVAYLMNLENKRVLHTVCELNAQNTFGADVISRIEHSNNNGLASINDAITNQINRLTEECCTNTGINVSDIKKAVITGNTTMLHFLTELDPRGIALFPFAPQSLFGDRFKSDKLIFSVSCEIYLPRCVSAYVGADITCAIIACGMKKSKQINSLLCDIGTNGEMALYADNKLICCSTAAGPAFEGANIQMGMTASEGAIDKVYIEDSQIKYTVLGNGKAVGLCGTGILDAAAVMSTLGIIDETGRLLDYDHSFTDDIIDFEGKQAFLIPNSNVVVTAEDIRKIQLAKSAICAGILTLLHDAGCSMDTIDVLYIAGGFGSYLNPHSVATIGLIPTELVKKAHIIGNAAGAGAVMMLLDDKLRTKSHDFTQEMTDINLSNNPYFMDKYIDCMMF